MAIAPLDKNNEETREEQIKKMEKLEAQMEKSVTEKSSKLENSKIED